MSLIPEKYLSLSPQLAATLGLEEALLYQLLTELRALNAASLVEIPCEQLLTLLPFWQDSDIRRISNSLQEKGVLEITSAPFGREDRFSISFERATKATGITPQSTASPRASMSNNWLPAPDVVAQLSQIHGISRAFIEQQIPEFVTYWTERNEPQYSWNSKFLKHVVRQWRSEEARSYKRSQEMPLPADWRPSPDAVEILNRQAGIHINFIEDAIPEFLLYWRERGESRSTWNTDFVRHVKNQWAKYTAALEHDGTPRVLEREWQPSEDLFEVLQLANIPREFALGQVAEFVLFWRENGQAHNSWNTKFLQHVKHQWARQGTATDTSHERHKNLTTPVPTRERSIVADLTDRSWAN